MRTLLILSCPLSLTWAVQLDKEPVLTTNPRNTHKLNTVDGKAKSDAQVAGRAWSPKSPPNSYTEIPQDAAVDRPQTSQHHALYFASHDQTGAVLAKHLGQLLAESRFGKNETFSDFILKSIDWNQTGVPFTDRGCTDVYNSPCPCASKPGFVVGVFGNINKPTLDKLDKDCSDYRMVHFVRDPVALATSGYFQHKGSNGTSETGRLRLALQKERAPPAKYQELQYSTHGRLQTPEMRVGPAVYSGMSLVEGLEVESEAQLKTTLRFIEEVEKESAERDNFLTIPIEAFEKDFNMTVMKVFNFLLQNMGRTDHEKMKRRLLDESQAWNTKVKGDAVLEVSDTPTHTTQLQKKMAQEQKKVANQLWEAPHLTDSMRKLYGMHQRYDMCMSVGCINGKSNSIPHVLHQSSKGHMIPERSIQYRSTWVTSHENWQFQFWTDQDNKALFRSHGMEKILKMESSDAARAYMMYHGGVYADLDVEPCQNLNFLIDKHDLVLVKSPGGNVSNFFMASVPGHPFWKYAADKFDPSSKENSGPLFLDKMWTAFFKKHPDTPRVKVYHFKEWQEKFGAYHSEEIGANATRNCIGPMRSAI